MRRFLAQAAVRARHAHLACRASSTSGVMSSMLTPRSKYTLFSARMTLGSRYMSSSSADLRRENVSASSETSLVPGESYDRLLSTLIADGRLSDAGDVLERMRESGVQPTALAYQKVIFAASRKQDTGLALRLLHDMIEHGLTPFVSTFGSVVAGLSRTGTPADCIRIIKLMQDVGVRPNEVVYTAAMKACVRHKDYSKTWDLFGEMRYLNITPDDVTYTVVMSACAKAREAERALLLFEEMKEKNLHLSVHTYGAVINACALRYDKHLEVFRLLAEMQGAGIACDQRMVGMLLHSCGTVGNVRGAHRVWNSMTARDSAMYVGEPSERMYTSLLKTYANAIRSRVPEVMKKLTAKQELVLSPQETAVAMRTESVDHVYARANEQACQELPPAIDETSLVPSANAMRLSSQEEWSVGELLGASDVLVKGMLARGLQPTVLTINRMLEGLTWGLQLDDALALLRSMQDEYGVAPDVESFRMVIGACIKLNKIETAYDLWEQMHRDVPEDLHDKGTYKHLIYGCAKVGAYKELVRVARGMTQAGVVPSPDEFMLLRKLLLSQGQDEAWDSVKMMCMKADRKNLWAIRDAEFRIQLSKYKPKKGYNRHKRPFEK